jgi:hypothetical protein
LLIHKSDKLNSIIRKLFIPFFVIANAVKQSKFYNEMYMQNDALPMLRECSELGVFAISGSPRRFAAREGRSYAKVFLVEG